MHERRIPYFKPTGGKALFLESEIEEFIQRSRKSADYELDEKANTIFQQMTLKSKNSYSKNGTSKDQSTKGPKSHQARFPESVAGKVA